MELSFDLPLFAMQRTDNGRWLVRTPSAGDPLLPAAAVMAAIDEPVSRCAR